jgi:psiF repeat
MRIERLLCAAAMSLFAAQGALAFDAAAPDTPAGASTAAPKAPPAPGAGGRSARSIECSEKADAKGLHGKPRKHFMRDCKRGG